MTAATVLAIPESHTKGHLMTAATITPAAADIDRDAFAEPTIFVALARVMAGVRPVAKTSTNTEQHYNFRGIDAVVNAVSPQLREHSVIVVPEVLESSYRDVTTSRGKPSREVTVKVRYRFYGPRGDYIDAVTCGESMDFGDKGTAKAMSVAFRVALLQALCLPTDEADPDSFSPERAYRDERTEAAEFGEQRPADPTPEQIAAFDQAAKEIAACQSLSALQKLWPDIVRRNETREIHNSHCPALIEARDAAAREIRAGAGEAP
jgi:hypothetical protein